MLYKNKYLILVVVSLSFLMADWSQKRSLYYKFSMNNQVMGYVEVQVLPKSDHVEVHSRTFIQASLMGQSFDVKATEMMKLSSDGKRQYFDSNVTQGETQLGSTVSIKDGFIHFTSKSGGEEKKIEAAGVTFESYPYYRNIVKDLGDGQKHTYRVFSDQTGEVEDVTYQKKREEEITLAGKKYQAIVASYYNKNSGQTQEIWYEVESGCVLKTQLPGNVEIAIADPNILGKIKRVEIDDLLFARVNVSITDYTKITYMKLNVKIRTAGEIVTPESLNVPGQSFRGKVVDNVIEGVFEIAHAHYDGKDAPAFPTTYDKELQTYLQVEQQIEADDSLLIDHAKKITAGAKDSWDAVRKISRWVSENISYKIPGGSARQTFDSKTGECASHSRLVTALCRGVGIPARLASGGMYTPLYGGSFGQHVWNEVYMGKAGWIPIDSTANEIDYVDSGHLRIGNLASFNPQNITVEEHRILEQKATDLVSQTKAPWEIGKEYTYSYSYQGKKLGTDSFRIVSFKDGVYTCENKLAMTGLNSHGTWKLHEDMRPISYKLEGKTPQFAYTLDCAFSKDKVVEKVIKGMWPVTKTVPLQGDHYLFDNSNLGTLAMIVTKIPRKEGEKAVVKIFHPSSIRVLTLQIEVGKQQNITVNGKEYSCWMVDISLAGMPLKVWVDDTGRILRETENAGNLVIELQNP
ncbi:transglutaminase-like domain-containing protein [Candidatus Uabimicrobium amorphum]|uniref:Cysteine protease n=1 Tax=Uabimicrobium amorphum TaxID=2596890 RepID=A0A5S9F221_UABAM|nr:transglutaminase-like domain-containing protein [Candidatus Uabimicrobium amorphum]BBM81999.1 cysteine protease [Candidatus Uabimicrobium amorphum]